MQLSKRLQAVADFVSLGSRVADVGCDHAYTAIYLTKNKISPQVIAMDVNQGPIDRAKENIIKYGCEDCVEARKSDGLEKLECGEADTILIAGMGGALTVQILSEPRNLIKSIRELVLQPQSEVHKVRQFLQEQGFLIVDENMLKEDGKYYVMMKAVRRNLVEDSQSVMLIKKEHFHYGKLLLERENPILKEFLLWDLELCEAILKTLSKVQTDNTQLRLGELEEKIELIHIGIDYFRE